MERARPDLIALLAIAAATAACLATLSETGWAAQRAVLAYAERALREGHGLLWNPLENAGQPFLATNAIGLLYPPQLALSALGTDRGLWFLAGLHLALGAVGLYLLARRLGLRPLAAVAGALVYGLGGTATGIAALQPATALGAWAWLPVALLLTEGLLERATPWRGVGLGLVLTLQVLVAAPALVVCTALLIVGRIAWQLGATRATPAAPLVAALCLAGLVPPLLGAGQILPWLEWLRGSGIRLSEGWAWGVAGLPVAAPGVTLAGAVLAPLALLRSGTRGRLAFYVLASLTLLGVHVAAGCAPSTLARLLAPPDRFLWGAVCPLAVAVACGVDALLPESPGGARRMWMAVAAGVLGVAACAGLGWSAGAGPVDWLLAAAAIVACAVAFGRGGSWLAAGLVSVLLLASLVHAWPGRHRIEGRRGETMGATLYPVLRQRTWPQYRSYLASIRAGDFRLTPAAASAFGAPGVGGEVWPGTRFGELMARLEQGRSESRAAAIAALDRPLLALLGVRFLVTDADRAAVAPLLAGEPRFVSTLAHPGLIVLENPRAIPRVSFVPRVEVERDPRALLERLASPEHDPRRVALVEQSPFLSDLGGGDARARLTLDADRSERLELTVDATRAGYVVVADRYDPGWRVTVGGRPTQLLRANYAFRAVAVPQGRSRVVFTYTAPGLVWGVLLSAATFLALAVAGLAGLDLRRHRRAAVWDAAGADAVLRTGDDVLLAAAALVCTALAAVVGVRVAFPCDLLMWAESPFMTDMMKLASGQPVFNQPADLNGFVYAPGLAWLTYATLAPLGLALDIRWCRLVSVALGLGAAACAAAVATTPRPRPAAAGALRRGGLLGGAAAALIVLGSASGDVPHPDNLHLLHASASLLLCCLALRRGDFRVALAAVALAGLGGLCKQPAALTGGGVLLALLVGHAWGTRRALALIGAAVGVTALALSVLLGSPEARLFTLEITAGHPLEPDKLLRLLGELSGGHRLLLLALAPFGLVWLTRGRGRFGRQYLLAWGALGATAIAPSLLAFFKFMGADNNLTGLSLWLLLVVWPWLAWGDAGETRLAGLARRAVVLLLLLSLVPWKPVPVAETTRYCRELIERVGEDVRAGRRVLLGHGTSPLILNGALEPPRDRNNTLMEIALAGRADLLEPMRGRLATQSYDRIYVAMWPEYMQPALGEYYQPGGSIEGAAAPALLGALPTWLNWKLRPGYILLQEMKTYMPRPQPVTSETPGMCAAP